MKNLIQIIRKEPESANPIIILTHVRFIQLLYLHLKNNTVLLNEPSPRVCSLISKKYYIYNGITIETTTQIHNHVRTLCRAIKKEKKLFGVRLRKVVQFIGPADRKNGFYYDVD
jgi:hypothetical protein